MREAANYLQAVAGAIADEMDAERKSRTNDVLEKVLLYIDNHLAEDLTLTRLAEISYLNASYLSRIFNCLRPQPVKSMRFLSALDI